MNQRVFEKVITANLSKISRTMETFKRWAKNRGLKPSETVYFKKTRRPKTDQSNRLGSMVP